MSFEEAAAKAKTFTTRPSDADLLKLYGLYKQATVGDNTTSQPWAVQLEARAKWDAWTACSGMSQESAKEDYVALVEKLSVDHA